MDLLVPLNKRDKDQLTIREDVAGGIKVSPTFFNGTHTGLSCRWTWVAAGFIACLRSPSKCF